MTAKITPGIVEGSIIRTSLGTVMLCAVGSALLAFGAGFVLWDTWGHKDGEYLLPFHLAKDSLFTSFVVLLCLVGGTGCSIAFTVQSLFPSRLILGENLLQIVRTGLFGEAVTLQIPYHNIATVACEKETHGFEQLLVGIDLCRHDDAETYGCGGDLHGTAPDVRDAYLPSFFIIGPEEIAQQITDKCRKKATDSGG